MLQYIQEHYNGELTLAQIAGSANISENELPAVLSPYAQLHADPVCEANAYSESGGAAGVYKPEDF